jgi:aerobic-type carbon monoxide dehydrogenase small subunit (CoxS/CutS family)
VSLAIPTAPVADDAPAAPTFALRTRVNGRNVDLIIQPQETLAEVLRERLRLTGTKVSCDVQVCGACTVLVDGLPVSACTYLAYETRGREVLTIEGLASARDELHPIQQAFVEENGFQCGFCTPGMIMAAKSLLDQQPEASEADIVAYMEGNICRCTGYRPIVAAIRRAQATLRRGPAGPQTPA